MIWTRQAAYNLCRKRGRVFRASDRLQYVRVDAPKDVFGLLRHRVDGTRPRVSRSGDIIEIDS